MRLSRFLLPIAFLFGFLSAPAQAQNTATVAGSIKDIFNVTDTSSQVCFTLKDTRADNSGAYQNPVSPRLAGVGLMNGYNERCVDAPGGNYSYTPFANDKITTQNGTATVWAVTLKSKHGGENTLGTFRFLAGNTYDLSNALPITTVPAVTPPTGDGTYARLDGLNQPFTGLVNASANITTPTVIGPPGGAVNIQGGAGTTFALGVKESTGTSNLFIVNNNGDISGLAFSISHLGALFATSASLGPTTITGSLPALNVSSGSAASAEIALGRTGTDAVIGVMQGSGFFVSNADGAAGDTAYLATSVSRHIYLGAVNSGAAPASISNTGLNLYTTSGTLPAPIQNDGGGSVQVGNGSLSPPLTVGPNPFSAFSINPGTSLASNPTGGQARRGMTYANDPLGDVTFWYNSSQTGAGYFFKDGNGGAVMAVPTGAGSLVSRTTTDTLTNKRITPRVVILTTSTTFTPDGDNSDITQMQMTGVTGTLTIASPTGTPVNGQKLIIKIIATNSQTYSFNAIYHFSTTVTAPTTIGAGKTDYIGCIWNSTNAAWDAVAVDQGH